MILPALRDLAVAYVKHYTRKMAGAKRVPAVKSNFPQKQQTDTAEPIYQKDKTGKAEEPLILQIAQQISSRWDLRYNTLLNDLEVRPAGNPTQAFTPIDERTSNTIRMEVLEQNQQCYMSWIDCFLRSKAVPQYHPLRAYLEGLPAWDGSDRMGELAARISEDALWTKVFRCWLRGAVKGWLGAADGAALNVFDCQTAPLLVSEQQGLGKSTFCRMLLPESLRMYYTEKFDLTADSHAEKKLGQFALINMDEFDRYSERQMGVLKNLMQLTEVKLRRPRSRALVEVRRIAAFIGTSNYAELLTDPTGSRRFFCQEVKAPINNAPIDYEQLYAQVMAELAEGQPTFFTKAEEAEIQAHNATFYRHSPLAEAFAHSFTEEGKDEWLSAGDIFNILKHDSPKALQGITITRLGRELRRLGVPKQRTRTGIRYCVKAGRRYSLV